MAMPRAATREGRAGVLAAIERRAGLKPTAVIFVVLIAGGWIVARFLGSIAMFRLTYGALLVLILAWLAGRRRVSAEAVRSEVAHRMREGQTAEVEVRVTAKRKMNNVILEDTVPPMLGTSTPVPVPLLPRGGELTFKYAFAPRARGIYKLGPLEASWTDPFGLTRNRMVIAGATEIIVHPRTQDAQDRIVIREWEDPPIRPPISKPWPTGFEFYGMREYSSGDDPRRIVWRVTARSLDLMTGSGRYMVRESEQGVTDRVSLILDTNASAHSPGRPSETFETAIRAVASLGLKHLHDGVSVTVEKNSGRLVGPLRGRRSEVAFLDELARLDFENEPLTEAIERLAINPRRDLHNVVVTPGLDDKAATGLKVLVERGASVLLVLVTWEETEPDAHRRAASLGCSVVHLSAEDSLAGAFRRLVHTRAPR